uniref:Uncharacterized protein n=1 Tax=Solanum tuberosum TaxID=4113 RepID=M1DVA1_SOLTU
MKDGEEKGLTILAQGAMPQNAARILGRTAGAGRQPQTFSAQSFERREKKRRKEEKKQGFIDFLENFVWISPRVNPYEGTGAPPQPECPNKGSDVWALGNRAIQRAPTQSLNFCLWRPAPLKAPRTPGLPPFPTSFRTSSLAMYLCFLVDFYTQSFPFACSYIQCTDAIWATSFYDVDTGRPARRDVEEQGVPNAPEVQPQGEVTNAEF